VEVSMPLAATAVFKTSIIWMMLRSATSSHGGQTPWNTVASEYLDCWTQKNNLQGGSVWAECPRKSFQVKYFQMNLQFKSWTLQWVGTGQFLRCLQGIFPIFLLQSVRILYYDTGLFNNSTLLVLNI
jgi:hypothetical protein